ncbi:MAG: hypothetical protein NZT61_07635, partial [Deltaproteobacteria bacterium]|nr:hypothetical protein [Deltaproteobacteria bacterium]
RYDVRSLTHEGANEARYYWKKGLVQLAQASEIAKVAEKSLGFVKTLAGFSVQVSNDGETPTVVCNLNEHYKKNRFPREAKILDPLIARAYLEFLERGLWDSSKDKEIASKWGVPQSEVEYARRHLYGSIDEAWFRKHNFTGLGNLPQDPEQAKKIVEKLCKDTERLLRDRKDRLNPTLVTGLNILFSTAGTLIVNPGLTAIKALESAAVGAGAAYVAKQAGIPKEVAQAVSILAGAQVIKGNAKRTSSGPNLPPGEQ